MAQLSIRYAAAFFDLACERNQNERGVLDALVTQVAAAKEYISDAAFKNFINHPNVSKDDKVKFLDGVLANAFENTVRTELKDFLHLLIARSRENIMAAALGEFIKMADKHMGKFKARVTSAAPLTTAQAEEIKQNLSKQLSLQQGKEVTLAIEADVDPALIGGVVINVDGKLIDQSVKNRLNVMKTSLM